MPASIAKTYRLKPMAAARLFAETTVLALLLALPAILLLHGDFWRITAITRALTVGLSLIALVTLPAYGFVTYKVTTSSDGLTTFSLFQKQAVAWQMIEALRLKTFWGSRRYCIAVKDGSEASFPVWLSNVKELAETIRSALPNRGRTGGGGAKVYDQNLPSTVLQASKMIAGLVFIGVLWTFYYSLQKHKSGHADSTDVLVILFACVVLTGMMLVRCLAIVLMPFTVSVEPAGLSVRTVFFQRRYGWSDIKRLSAPFFFLPEGLLVRTTSGMFLIGDQLEGFDELEEELVEKLPPATASN